MTRSTKAYLIGGGIGSMAAAAFMIRDGGVLGTNVTIFEEQLLLGGSLDGAGDPGRGYSLRGGRMLTTDNYECTWDLFRSIPSASDPGKSVFEETVEFNRAHLPHSMARLVDRRRARVPVTSMGFSMQDRLELLKLSGADEEALGASRITDWLSPGFFETEFWFMWATTFAFQPWHSAVEFKRYLHRFMLEFSRIETLAGVKRTMYNQYDSLVAPLQAWLLERGVRFVTGAQVTALDHETRDGHFRVSGVRFLRKGQHEFVAVGDDDLVFLQNGSMTDASSLGSMTSAPAKRTRVDSGGWSLWETLAEGRPQLGRPAAFNRCIAQSWWESFTVTLDHPSFFDEMRRFTGNEAGTGGLVTFKDSRWLMSIVPGPPAALPESARRRAGVLGICALSRSHRRLRAQADGRLHRRRDSPGALRAPALRPGDRVLRQLHSLPHALHHEHVHASRSRRSALACSAGDAELRLRQPVRGNRGRRRLHRRVFGAGGADGRLPAPGHRSAGSTRHAARQVSARGRWRRSSKPSSDLGSEERSVVSAGRRRLAAK